MPRGRPNPLGQVANRGSVHSVAGLEVLQQDRTELDEAHGRLAPGDDGVHAGAIAVVGADSAVAGTVEGCGVAARATVTLTCDEIDERRFLGLLQLVPLSELGQGLGAQRVRGFRDPDRSSGPAGVSPEYTAWIPYGQEGEPMFSEFGPIVPIVP